MQLNNAPTLSYRDTLIAAEQNSIARIPGSMIFDLTAPPKPPVRNATLMHQIGLQLNQIVQSIQPNKTSEKCDDCIEMKKRIIEGRQVRINIESTWKNVVTERDEQICTLKAMLDKSQNEIKMVVADGN